MNQIIDLTGQKRDELYGENTYSNPTIHRNPTANCQVYSIAGISGILRTTSRSKCLASFRKIQQAIGKNIIMIDINNYSEYIERVEDIFKDRIISKTPYNSTNGSRMVLYLLDARDLLKRKDNKYIMR